MGHTLEMLGLIMVRHVKRDLIKKFVYLKRDLIKKRTTATDPIHMGHTLEMLGLIMVGFAGHAVFPTLRYCVAVCCSVVPCVAVCCSVLRCLQCVAVKVSQCMQGVTMYAYRVMM